MDLCGRVLIQRTTNGTRGLAWTTAPLVLAAAAVNAAATARLAAADEHRAYWIRQRTPLDEVAHEADVAACAEVDRYPFAMVGERHPDFVRLTRVDV